MSFKIQAAMASRLRDDMKPRRFDLTMSRRTRRPGPAATSATGCHEQDHHQAVDVEGSGFQPVVVQPERQDPDGLFRLSDYLQSRQAEDAHQEHETSEERSEDTTKEQQASPPQTCRLQKKDDESKAQQQEEEECQDNSRRFSLLELIEDETVDGGVKDAATGCTEEENAAAAAAVREVAAGAAAEGESKRSDQVAGRRVIGFGIMRRYVKVRSIKTKRASPEKNATPVC